MNRNKMNLQRFATNIVTRNDAAALIPEQISKEIIQSATESSTVLQLGKRLPNMTSNKTSMPVLDMLPVAYLLMENQEQSRVQSRPGLISIYMQKRLR